jgi:hypothetical protein
MRLKPPQKSYDPPFEFTARMDKGTVDVSGKMIQDTKGSAKKIVLKEENL